MSKQVQRFKENEVSVWKDYNYAKRLSDGETWIILSYNADAVYLEGKIEGLEYVQPKEGGHLWADNLTIIETSDKKDIANQFINYMLQPKVSAMNSNAT